MKPSYADANSRRKVVLNNQQFKAIQQRLTVTNKPLSTGPVSTAATDANPASTTATTTTPAPARTSNSHGVHVEHENHSHHTHNEPPDSNDTTNAGPAKAVTFQLVTGQWVMSMTNSHGQSRSLNFSDPDGDGTFTPVRPDPVTGQGTPVSAASSSDTTSKPDKHPHPPHQLHGRSESLTLDGGTLVLTATERFGSLVVTFKDDDQDGIFTQTSAVFKPLNGSSTPISTGLLH